MFLALLTGLTAQAVPLATLDEPMGSFVAPSVTGTYSLVGHSLRADTMPVAPQRVYGEIPWLLTGLALCGTGAVTMGVSAVVMSATDNQFLDTSFGVIGLIGALHFVVGASMVGIEFTEGRSARVFFTGTGFAGRF